MFDITELRRYKRYDCFALRYLYFRTILDDFCKGSLLKYQYKLPSLFSTRTICNGVVLNGVQTYEGLHWGAFYSTECLRRRSVATRQTRDLAEYTLTRILSQKSNLGQNLSIFLIFHLYKIKMSNFCERSIPQCIFKKYQYGNIFVQKCLFSIFWWIQRSQKGESS